MESYKSLGTVGDVDGQYIQRVGERYVISPKLPWDVSEQEMASLVADGEAVVVDETDARVQRASWKAAFASERDANVLGYYS